MKPEEQVLQFEEPSYLNEALHDFKATSHTQILSMRISLIFLASIFIAAGVEKWNDPADFEAGLIRLELLPSAMISPISVGIPLLEIALGLMCLVTIVAKPAIQGLAALTALYTSLLIYEWLRGIDTGCGCFGVHSGHWPHWALLLRNVGLLVLEACLLRQQWPAERTAPAVTTNLRSHSQLNINGPKANRP